VVATGLVLSLRPWLAEIHDYYGLHLGAALAGALLGIGSAFFVGNGRMGTAAARWLLLPLLTGLFWAIVVAVALQMAVLVWYLSGDLLLEPLLGPEIGFPLSALVGGAVGGGFAGYLCSLVLGLSAEASSPRPE